MANVQRADTRRNAAAGTRSLVQSNDRRHHARFASVHIGDLSGAERILVEGALRGARRVVSERPRRAVVAEELHHAIVKIGVAGNEATIVVECSIRKPRRATPPSS